MFSSLTTSAPHNIIHVSMHSLFVHSKLPCDFSTPSKRSCKHWSVTLWLTGKIFVLAGQTVPHHSHRGSWEQEQISFQEIRQGPLPPLPQPQNRVCGCISCAQGQGWGAVGDTVLGMAPKSVPPSSLARYSLWICQTDLQESWQNF